MSKHVLITGASGFVGAALAECIFSSATRDEHIVSMVRDRTQHPCGTAVVYGDVRDEEFCRRVLADYEIDVIYHLAAHSIVSACAEDPASALDVAVMGTTRLLHAARLSGRPVRVVVITSDKAYGHAPSPYDESTPFDARHAYEVSKACQDLVARMFFYNYGMDVRIVRAVNIYGPGDPNHTRLIPRTAQRLLRGEAPLLHAGAAEMRRQYVYINDMVNALLTVANRGQAGEAYCVGSPDAPMSVLEVMRAMAETAGVPWVAPDVRERDTRFHEIAAQSVIDYKLRGLGWTPTVPFKDGIKLTIDSYRTQL